VCRPGRDGTGAGRRGMPLGDGRASQTRVVRAVLPAGLVMSVDRLVGRLGRRRGGV